MRTSVRHRFVRGRGGRIFRPFGWAAAAALLALSVLSPAMVGAANPPQPTYGSAVVDGKTGDWDLTNDRFAAMTDNGYVDKPTVAYLYLRYDCDTETLYALVLGVDGNQFRQTRPENAYIRIDGSGKLFSGNSGNNGTPPDFEWVNGDGTLADGFEGSGKVDAADHTVRAHILRPDNSPDGYESVDNISRDVPLVLKCAKPTPTPTPKPTPTPSGSVSPSGSATHDPSTSPSSSVASVTGKPHVTLPPTSTIGAGDPPATSLGLVFLGLGLVLAGALVLIEMPKLARGRRRR
jgi:hypothetical protein